MIPMESGTSGLATQQLANDRANPASIGTTGKASREYGHDLANFAWAGGAGFGDDLLGGSTNVFVCGLCGEEALKDNELRRLLVDKILAAGFLELFDALAALLRLFLDDSEGVFVAEGRAGFDLSVLECGNEHAESAAFDGILVAHCLLELILDLLLESAHW